jgi:HSP20 family protein
MAEKKKKRVRWFWEKEPDESEHARRSKASPAQADSRSPPCVHELLHEMQGEDPLLLHRRNKFRLVGEPFGFKLGFKMPKHMHAIGAVAPVNISEMDKELIVRAELPGFKKDEIKLVVTRDTFELSAEKKHEEIERGETFYRREAARQTVHRAFALPVSVDADRVSAKLEEGILIVTIPKLEVEKKKKKAVEIA